jgi:hypothetical protein
MPQVPNVRRQHQCSTYPVKCLVFSLAIFNVGNGCYGPVEPISSNGQRFILVAIDYFINWVEVASNANVTWNAMVKFIKKELICRYGTNLNNKMMT